MGIRVRVRSRAAESGMRGLRRALGAGVLGLALILAGTFPSQSLANQAHYYAGGAGSFGGPGRGAGQLELVAPQFPAAGGSGVAVNETTHDIYVADTGNHRISEFESSGVFVRAWGWGVLDGNAETQTCTGLTGCEAGVPGSAPGQLESPLFVAVDNDLSSPSHGDVYVAEAGDGIITKYDGEGALQSVWGTGGQMSGLGQLQGIAVGTDGDLWVYAGQEVARFGPAGEPIGAPFGAGPGGGSRPSGLAVDGRDEIYAVEGLESVGKLDSAGNYLGRVTESPAGPDGSGILPPVGLATDQVTNEFFADEVAAIGAYSIACEPQIVSPCVPFQSFGEAQLDEGAGLAVDSSFGNVYAASAGNDEILAFPPAVEATTEAATDVTASTATLNGKIDAFGSDLTACRFEYGVGTAEGDSSVPCVGTPAPNGQVAVEAPVSGLEGKTTYSFRLSATNANGHVEGDEGFFTTLESPGIVSAEAKELSAESAVLVATIDPRGSETHYHFEWGPCEGGCPASSYPATVPVPDGRILPGTPTTVEQAISGLSPGTTYHFRVFAENANGPVAGTEHTFVYLPSAPIQAGCGNEELRQLNGSTSLPDCRAYELVTPAMKNGSLIGAIFIGHLTPQIAEDGSRMTVAALQCLPGTPSCIGHRQSEGEPYEFFRGPDGWQVNPLAPPAAQFQTHSWLLFGADPGTLLFSAPDSAGTEDIWARSEDGSFSPVGPLGQPGTSYNVFSPRAAVSTADLSHVVYETVRPVWPFDAGSTSSLYEYTPASGAEPQLVGVTGGFEEGENHNLISVCGTGLGNGGPTDAVSAYNTLSEDGRIVYFTARPCGTGSGTNTGREVPAAALYERIDQSRTIDVSAATPATCTTPECEGSTSSGTSFESRFEGASRSGERAVFTSTQQLTDGASQDRKASDQATSCETAISADSGCNLYLSECPGHCEEPSQRRLIDVSEGAKGEGGPKVLGVVAMSADAGRIFFVANGVLTTAQNQQGEEAVSGGHNLYLYERDEAHPQGRLTFVAKLAIQDRPNWAEGFHYQGPGSLRSGQGLGTANITPDGRYLVFESRRALTPGAVVGPAQIYRYDAQNEEMTRVSIGQAGFGDDGNAGQAGSDATIVAAKNAFVLGDGPALTNPTMSTDGRFVFFQSPLALTPGALNEVVVEETGIGTKIYAQNIYEWEEEGAGGCHELGGCVSLLSNGTEEIGGTIVATPELLGTDATGENVFIAAKDPLTWQDTDTQRDYYDLRVGGGFVPPGAGAQPCGGDGCRGQGTSASAGASPVTSTTSGPEEGPRHPRKPKQNCRKKKGRKGSACQKHHKKNGHKAGGRKHHRKRPVGR